MLHVNINSSTKPCTCSLWHTIGKLTVILYNAVAYTAFYYIQFLKNLPQQIIHHLQTFLLHSGQDPTFHSMLQLSLALLTDTNTHKLDNLHVTGQIWFQVNFDLTSVHSQFPLSLSPNYSWWYAGEMSTKNNDFPSVHSVSETRRPWNLGIILHVYITKSVSSIANRQIPIY